MEGGVLGGLCGGGLRGRGSGRTVCRPSLAMAAKTLAAAAKRRWDGLRCGLRRALCREARRSRARTGRRPRLLRRWPPIPLSSRGPSTSWFVVKDGGEGLACGGGRRVRRGRRGVRDVSSPEETNVREDSLFSGGDQNTGKEMGNKQPAHTKSAGRCSRRTGWWGGIGGTEGRGDGNEAASSPHATDTWQLPFDSPGSSWHVLVATSRARAMRGGNASLARDAGAVVVQARGAAAGAAAPGLAAALEGGVEEDLVGRAAPGEDASGTAATNSSVVNDENNNTK